MGNQMNNNSSSNNDGDGSGSGDEREERECHNQDAQLTQLTPEGQQFLSLIREKSKYASYIEDRINKVVNGAAEMYLDDIKDAVRNSVFDEEFDQDEEEAEAIKTRGLNKDWYDEEKVEAAVRSFPDVLSEKSSDGDDDDCYPIIWRTMYDEHGGFNLKALSLIPLLTELGTELGRFDEEMRGGLLCTNSFGASVLFLVCCMNVQPDSEADSEAVEDCCLGVMMRLRERNHFAKEDILEQNIFRGLFASDNGIFAEKRFRYLVEWDPTPLSMPCVPDRGTWLPIHWSADKEDVRQFRLVLEAGLKYFPEKLGFVFCEGEQTDEDNLLHVGNVTAFELACEEFGTDEVTKLVADCIANCPAADTVGSESFLLSIAADEAIQCPAFMLRLLRKAEGGK